MTKQQNTIQLRPLVVPAMLIVMAVTVISGLALVFSTDTILVQIHTWAATLVLLPLGYHLNLHKKAILRYFTGNGKRSPANSTGHRTPPQQTRW